jgi:uncharacterized protein involved in exopolysaccharide biosynthesis
VHATEERVSTMRAAETDAGAFSDDGLEVSLYGLAAMVLRKVRVGVAIAGLVILVAVPFAVSSLLSQRTFTATASFMPEREMGGGLGGAAEALSRLGFGVTLGAGGPGSMHYYEDVLKTRSLLDRVSSLPYQITTETGTQTVALSQLGGYEGSNPEAASEAAAEWLRDRMRINVSASTGILRFDVTTPDAGLSKAVADRIIEAVHAHNVTRRQAEARGERHFIEGRLGEARAELEQSEAMLVAFLRENRQFELSPELRLRYERFQRDINMKQQVVLTLVQGFEQARIAELRNTPSISVIDEPRAPVKPDPRRSVVMWAFWIALLATFTGIVAALASALAERSRSTGSQHYREFESAVAELKSTLGRSGSPT